RSATAPVSIVSTSFGAVVTLIRAGSSSSVLTDTRSYNLGSRSFCRLGSLSGLVYTLGGLLLLVSGSGTVTWALTSSKIDLIFVLPLFLRTWSRVIDDSAAGTAFVLLFGVAGAGFVWTVTILARAVMLATRLPL